MKNEVFNKMKEYGWNLDSFIEVYNTHHQFIDEIYEYFREKEENDESVNLNDINKENLLEMVVFMSDFLRAFNEIAQDRDKDMV